jgi:hypothetical protein
VCKEDIIRRNVAGLAEMNPAYTSAGDNMMECCTLIGHFHEPAELHAGSLLRTKITRIGRSELGSLLRLSDCRQETYGLRHSRPTFHTGSQRPLRVNFLAVFQQGNSNTDSDRKGKNEPITAR